MSQPVDLRNPGRKLHVGVVLMHKVTEILDVAPVDLFCALQHDVLKDIPPTIIPDDLKAQAVDLEIHWVTETGAPHANLTSNAKILPTDSFATCPPLDIILLGANGLDYKATEAEIAFLRKCEPAASAFLCICLGIEPVMAAGLLEGKTATAPRFLLPMVRESMPGVNWVEKRWARDGKIWTSGALLNGLDMVSAFAQETWGGEGTLVERWFRLGGWPIRDVDYKDVAWKI